MSTTQASRVFAKFGGVRKLWKALRLVNCPLSITTLYRWGYERERGGCGGLIPTKSMPYVLRAARLEGIVLTSDDTSPVRTPAVNGVGAAL